MADISNFVSALTQGNEDATSIQNGAQVTTVGSGTVAMPGDTDRVWQFTGNASQGALTFPHVADNHTDPTSNHIIVGFLVRFTDVGPASEIRFFGIMNSAANGPSNTGNVQMSLVLETDGDIRLDDITEGTIATATTPVNVDTWYVFEVRFLPDAGGSTGECQVYYKEFGSGSMSDLFSGNQTSLNLGSFAGMLAFFLQGPPASSGNMFGVGGYISINSTADSDRLDSDFEIIGPYQDTAISGTTSDNGNNLDAGDWANVNEIPFSDTAAYASFNNNPDLGGIHLDGGTRSGPSSDSRVDGDSNIKAWRAIWRGERGNGGGGDQTFYIGDDGATWTSGFDSMVMTLTTADSNYYFCTDVSTNMPASTDNFSLGFGTAANRDIDCREMAAFVLHVPAGGAQSVEVPKTALSLEPKLPEITQQHIVDVPALV